MDDKRWSGRASAPCARLHAPSVSDLCPATSCRDRPDWSPRSIVTAVVALLDGPVKVVSAVGMLVMIAVQLGSKVYYQRAM